MSSEGFNEQSLTARRLVKEETKKRIAGTNVGCTLEISGYMTSLAHLASGYEVGSCAASQLARVGRPYPVIPSHPAFNFPHLR